MSNAIIGNLITKVGCDVSNLLEGFEKSKSATRSYAGDIGAIASGNLIAAGVEKGLELIKELAYAVVECAENMKKLTLEAHNLGVSTSTMQTLKFATQEAGMEVADLEKYMRKLAVNVIEKPKIFEQLGIDAQKLTGLGLDKQFEIMRDRLMEIENINDRMALANSVFGKGGASALNIDTKDAKRQQDDMGGVVDPQAVERLTRLSDEIGKCWEGIKNAGIKFLSVFAETGIGIVKIIDVIVQGINNFLNTLEYLKQNFDFVPTDVIPVLAILRKIGQLFSEQKEPPPLVNTESIARAQELSEAIDTLTEKLELEKATMGMTADQVEIWKLKKKGATDEALKHCEALAKQNEAVKKGIEEEKRMTEEIKKQAEAREKQLQQRAKAITEANYTPEQKFKADMMELNQMIDEGRISWETYDRAARKASENLGKDITTNASANYAVEYGSAKMYDLMAKLIAEADQKAYQERLLKEAQLQNESLRAIADNTNKQPQVATI